MKYIIEIEDAPFESEGSCLQLWKATEFNSLVFDKRGLEKLTPYEEADTPDQAWELARWAFGEDSPSAIELDDIFGGYVLDMPYAEAKAKYDAWKERKDEIQVGDEVIRLFDNRKFIVSWITINQGRKIYDGFTKEGVTVTDDEVRKTGRHFPEVAELLKKMGEQE